MSPELQDMIAAGVLPFWHAHPQTKEDWKIWVQQRAEFKLNGLPGLREKMHVKVAARDSDPIWSEISFLVA